ncbi:MAG: hypothetical protein AAB354_02520 [candidate division KSB1 bacterium]
MLRKVPIISLAVFCCFGNSACTPNYGNLLTSPADLPPSIFAFLNTASDSQYVILENAIPSPEYQGDFLQKDFERFRRAKVALSGAGESFVFDDQYELEATGGSSEIAHNFVFVSTHKPQTGKLYELHIEIPEKGTFTATTTVPSDFEISSPQAGDTLAPFDSLAVTWTSAIGAAGYRLAFRVFYLDSADFKRGRTDQIFKRYFQRIWYAEVSPSSLAKFDLNFDLFYQLVEGRDRTLLPVAKFNVEALDQPAWLARNINTRVTTTYLDVTKEALYTPGVYSNIANGYGLMTATTVKTLNFIIPTHKK